jgi:bacillithiol biosynthesis cysteine-adding enzyme BshC
LFTGPLYTIYKALSAIRAAEELSKAGVSAVPIFWMATEDHDFEEISKAFAVDAAGHLIQAKIVADESDKGRPVGSISVDALIETTIAQWTALFPDREGVAELQSLLASTYSSGVGVGFAFGRLLAKLLSAHGIIMFDPIDARAKKIAAPLVEKAIAKADEIVGAIQRRSTELVENGYHAQVLVEENYFPFFWIDDDGKRQSIKRSGENKYRIAGSKDEISIEALKASAVNEPERFSPGVMLRPVVQDYLFPTICYFGGGAEIAYFAQNSQAYRILERPITPIFHRQSFTVLEPKHARTMEKYGIKFEDVFRGLYSLLPEIIERVLDPETPRVFADAEEKINTELNRLDQQLSKIDPTLAESLAKRRRKIIYHIGALWKKTSRARLQKDELANRRLHSLFAYLYPNGGLQERTLNFAAFADEHGVQFIDWIYGSIDVENKDHRLIYL